MQHTVYPCVYREHTLNEQKNSLNIGLSLCVQGTSAYEPAAPLPMRFIPVYTGNIFVSYIPFIIFPGLSLCIQGTLTIILSSGNRTRFIPVYTGNIMIESRALSSCPVYPCVYREHPLFLMFND